MNTVIEEAAREICQISPSREPISISPQCDDYIRRASRVHQPDIRADAAKVAAKHLLLFLEEMPAGVTAIQWLASLNAGQTLNVPDPNAHYWSMFENFVSPNTIQGVKNAMDQDSQDVLEAFVQRMNDALSLRDVDAVKSVAEEFARWAESLSGPNKTSAEALSGMWSGPSNLLQPASYVHPFCREVTALKKWIQTSYLSTVMMGCPVFKDDTPFAPTRHPLLQPSRGSDDSRVPSPNGRPAKGGSHYQGRAEVHTPRHVDPQGLPGPEVLRDAQGGKRDGQLNGLEDAPRRDGELPGLGAITVRPPQ